MNRKSLPISAIVVGLNEGKLLEGCLNSINFCQEIMYFDLGSNDDSESISKSAGAVFHKHKLVPIGEYVVAEHAQLVKNDWILITDPDEKMDPELSNELISKFASINSDPLIGSISVPLVFYFKGHALLGTPWGGVNRRVSVANRERFIFSPEVHNGRTLKPGFREFEILYSGSNVIHHYWMNSWSQLFEKHLRYLKLEGQTRYSSSQRTNVFKVIIQPAKAFVYSYFYKHGYKDKLTGFLLSLFWAWYQTTALWELYKAQRMHAN